MSHHKPDPNKNVNLTIDGLPVTVPEGTRILEAARKAGIFIPTLCEHPDLCKRAVCRVCVVEGDGRGKLFAACASDVWEGANIVTNNARLAGIRKTIVELILANHPQECLTCIRSKNCELQSLAETLGIRESVFRREAMGSKPPVTESMTLVRDMAKCVKCGRCVEACQEVQTVHAINSSFRGIHYEISAPYGQSLTDGACVFCGQCSHVCPVGALYERDQSAEAWAALGSAERKAAVRIDSAIGAAFDEALGLPAGTVSTGKLVTALKRLGFGRVLNANIAAQSAVNELCGELLKRVQQGAKLPLIAGCWQGLPRFVENCCGDLANHVYSCSQPPDYEATIAVEPCLAKKYSTHAITLTVRETARMFTLAGIDFINLDESPFDEPAETGSEDSRQIVFHAIEGQNGVEGAELNIKGSKVQLLIVHGLGNARTIMESIRRGTCDAVFVEILCCPGSRAGCRPLSPALADALCNTNE